MLPSTVNLPANLGRMSEQWADKPTSWLLMIHVSPIPEDEEAQGMFDAAVELVESKLPGFKADVAAVYASKVEVVSLDDLDHLTTLDDIGFASTS